jgi:hypothetical protein
MPAEKMDINGSADEENGFVPSRRSNCQSGRAIVPLL